MKRHASFGRHYRHGYYLSCLYLILLVLLVNHDNSSCWALTASRNHHGSTRSSNNMMGGITSRTSSTRTISSTQLTLAAARRRRRYYHDEMDDGQEQERSTERPTLSKTQTIGPALVPAKPKIVVLGATGRIGRLVVRQLLESSMDVTVIACVKNYDKACKVFYHGLQLASHHKGPRLRIVEANLVPPEELPGYLLQTDEEEEEEWRQRASSAAHFYNTTLTQYDNRHQQLNIIDANEALKDAIQDATTIISCVGTVRPTNIWTDLLERPLWRWLKPDVSGWCSDPRHPYYVHYASTRKLLGIAEREQLRREAAVEMALEEEEEERDEPVVVPKIRFIRVSDNCLCQPAWEMVPLLTNICRSMVFRYQDMAERLLESSTLIDTVILRPGDLVDQERNVNTTHLQVDPTGEVPVPAIVGREDVASLAVASALFTSPRQQEASKEDKTKTNNGMTQQQQQTYAPFHCKLAVRWVGDDLHPYPKQGTQKDGCPTAQLSLQKALTTIKKTEKKERQFQRLARPKKRPLKPYGIVSAIPTYLVLTFLLQSLGRVLWTALSQKAWAQPFLDPIQQLATVVGAFLASYFGIVQQFVTRYIPIPVSVPFPRISRRLFGSKQYISF